MDIADREPDQPEGWLQATIAALGELIAEHDGPAPVATCTITNVTEWTTATLGDLRPG